MCTTKFLATALVVACAGYVFGQGQPVVGVVTSKTRKLDAEWVLDFKEGFAVVGKGTATAVIDSTAKFLVPYNKYIFSGFKSSSSTPKEGFHNGFCAVQDSKTGLYGFIDTSGKLAIPCTYMIVRPFDDDGVATVVEQKKYYFLSGDGKRTPVNAVFIGQSQGLRGANGGLDALFGSPQEREFALSGGTMNAKFSRNGLAAAVGPDGKFGYYDRTGSVKIAPQFDDAREFHMNRAAVAKKDEFGAVKWGFIDEKGTLVIPYKFSREPGFFSWGFALVEPQDKTAFDYAFIDFKGEVTYKIKARTGYGHSNEKKLVHYFQDPGLAFLPYQRNYSEFMLIGVDGDMNTYSDLLADFYKLIYKNYSSLVKIEDFNIIDNKLIYKVNSYYGSIDLATFYIMPPIFSTLYPFDYQSKLAHASLLTTDGKITEGYIDPSGRFSIILSKESTW